MNKEKNYSSNYEKLEIEDERILKCLEEYKRIPQELDMTHYEIDYCIAVLKDRLGYIKLHEVK